MPRRGPARSAQPFEIPFILQRTKHLQSTQKDESDKFMDKRRDMKRERKLLGKNLQMRRRKKRSDIVAVAYPRP
ncbi:hypothetical protein Y032_0559g3449 [Ancylostoma ceylanicum]|uniref:Uncharacterized protein n=1 Tax=Ancylostoma ceylanicum TaxID=53326 RepID=A0A016WQZ9_9BILA|nr:hypothetical protein Y032_0559g3449 [Ancylostoma ceylanicum]